MLEPLRYPLRPHVRKYAPAGYGSYKLFKRWLRDEFSFRCVYCLDRETWNNQGHRVFTVDHIVAQTVDGSLISTYSNLTYACMWCNSRKQEVALADPTQIGFGKLLAIESDGAVKALAAEGQLMILQLALNDPELIENRRDCFALLNVSGDYPNDLNIKRLFLRRFGYPQFLPDLRCLRPPGGNMLEGNTTNCFFAQREAKTLAETY